MTTKSLIAANENSDAFGQKLSDEGIYLEIDLVFPEDHSPAKRALLLATAKRHYEEVFPQTKRGVAQGQGSRRYHGKTSGQTSASAFKDLVVARTEGRRGWSLSSVKQVIHRGERIAPEVLEAIIEDEVREDRDFPATGLDHIAGFDRAYQMAEYLKVKSNEPPPDAGPPFAAPANDNDAPDDWWTSHPDFTENEGLFDLPGITTLVLGDSREKLKGFADASFDGAVTDNPYGIDYKNGAVEGDEDPDAIACWLAPSLARIIKPDSFAILHGVWRPLEDGREVTEVFRHHCAQSRIPMRQLGIWAKEVSSPFGAYLMHQHEMFWVCAKGKPRCQQWTDHWGLRGAPGRIVTKDDDLWAIRKPIDGQHDTSKPVDLHMRQLCNFVPAGRRVIDPFMGTGPVAVAALRTGHVFTGIEVKEKWFRIAVERVKAELRTMQPEGNLRLAA